MTMVQCKAGARGYLNFGIEPDIVDTLISRVQRSKIVTRGIASTGLGYPWEMPGLPVIGPSKKNVGADGGNHKNDHSEALMLSYQYKKTSSMSPLCQSI